ncbi:MAG: serine/threonine protein kinase [Gemmatimonadaceae bacterium]|nr:serine/threonine protein kinase [Gemmatimonadaceae bacterium]
MDANRWAQLKRVFNELIELDDVSREERLSEIDDEQLRDDVRALLRADAAVGARFERAPTLTGATQASVELDDELEPGRHVGAWRLLRLLGRGGMGAVYEAVRDDAGFTKRAALKMIARANADAGLIARFEAERRILARLEHRNIASLLDGGVDSERRPWFALEYVEGERLDHWSNTHALDVRARVQLFRQACSAVQYAHERLIVHRDIKPANMLVAEDGTLKLLDFGIAKLIDDSDNPLTEFGAAPMTAAYASPEQRAGLHLTTATDIYSLGVVLYELLTGMRPNAGQTTDAATLPPSRRIESLDEDTTGLAVDIQARRKLSRQLRGALDAIVMMALRPEPDRRYASAQQFGDDLQRWLDGRTVRAQPDTIGYRLHSFVRRNKLAVAGIATGVLALIGGTVISVQQARFARAERDKARAEGIRTQRVNEFFQTVLNQASPREGGRALTVAEALDRAVPMIDTAFASEPDIRASVQLSLGETLQNIQLHERARPLLQQAYEYYRTRDGVVPSQQQTDAIWNLATVARQDGKLVEAESLYLHLANVFQHRPDADANDVVVTLMRVAGLRLDAGDLTGAVTAYDSLIPKHRIRNRTDSLDQATYFASRGVAQATLGRFAPATADFSRAVSIFDVMLGKESFAVGEVLQPYAGALMFEGKLTDADVMARRAIGISTRAFGDAATGTLSAKRMLGTIMVAGDRCADAIPVFSEILSHRGPDLQDTDPSVGYALLYRGYCRAKSGDVRAGVRDAREGLELCKALFGGTHYIVHLGESLMGAAMGYGPRADRSEAEQLLRAGAHGLRETLGAGHPRTKDAEARLADFQRPAPTRPVGARP